MESHDVYLNGIFIDDQFQYDHLGLFFYKIKCTKEELVFLKLKYPGIKTINEIMKVPGIAYDYALHIIKGRWPEAEPCIMENAWAAYYYARYVIKGRWSEAEPYIMKDPFYWQVYRLEHLVK